MPNVLEKKPSVELVLPLHVPDESRRQRVRSHKLLLAAVLAGLTFFYLGSPRIPLREEHTHTPTCGSPSCARNPSWLIKAKHGAVASENELCSNIGVDTLKKGGNAVDAAISTTLCIGVVNMFSSGIGGGGFMTVRLPPSVTNSSKSEVYTIDFREVAPLAAHEKMFVADPNSARWGGLAVGVPGELRGLQQAHELWGKLAWKDLVKPSAKLARGWKVQKELERRIQMFQEPFLNFPDWKKVFAPKGCLLREGDTIRRTALARTLDRIAEEGPDVFYNGPIADAILAKIRETGGVMTQEDFDRYEVQVQPALQGTYRGRTIYTTHAPASGAVLLHMFNLLELYDDFVEAGRTGLNVHRLVEAMKFGFAARTRISDPAFVGTKEIKVMNDIPTKEYAQLIFRNLTDDRTHPPEYYQPLYDTPIDHGTSHSSVVDKDGMAVSITSTVNLVFGSLVLDSVTGVILNDELDDFSIPGTPNAFGLWPSPYNYPKPGKRPLSSTAPTIIEDENGDFYAAIGGSGGSRIFPAVFQVLLGLDWGLNPSEAVEYGRVHNQLYPMFVDADNIYPSELLDELKVRGHNVSVADISRVASVVQLIKKEGDWLYATSDSRKRGKAAGY